ncbi:MAG: hypothetical protein ACP5K8_05565, partial [Nitrososphaeria archaeon]
PPCRIQFTGVPHPHLHKGLPFSMILYSVEPICIVRTAKCYSLNGTPASFITISYLGHLKTSYPFFIFIEFH